MTDGNVALLRVDISSERSSKLHVSKTKLSPVTSVCQCSNRNAFKKMLFGCQCPVAVISPVRDGHSTDDDL